MTLFFNRPSIFITFPLRTSILTSGSPSSLYKVAVACPLWQVIISPKNNIMINIFPNLIIVRFLGNLFHWTYTYLSSKWFLKWIPVTVLISASFFSDILSHDKWHFPSNIYSKPVCLWRWADRLITKSPCTLPYWFTILRLSLILWLRH